MYFLIFHTCVYKCPSVSQWNVTNNHLKYVHVLFQWVTLHLYLYIYNLCLHHKFMRNLLHIHTLGNVWSLLDVNSKCIMAFWILLWLLASMNIFLFKLTLSFHLSKMCICFLLIFYYIFLYPWEFLTCIQGHMITCSVLFLPSSNHSHMSPMYPSSNLITRVCFGFVNSLSWIKTAHVFIHAILSTGE